jgi:hypothetical protein
MPKGKPIQGNRKHDIGVGGAQARAMEVAIAALSGETVTARQADAAIPKLTEVVKTYRAEDGRYRKAQGLKKAHRARAAARKLRGK